MKWLSLVPMLVLTVCLHGSLGPQVHADELSSAQAQLAQAESELYTVASRLNSKKPSAKWADLRTKVRQLQEALADESATEKPDKTTMDYLKKDLGKATSELSRYERSLFGSNGDYKQAAIQVALAKKAFLKAKAHARFKGGTRVASAMTPASSSRPVKGASTLLEPERGDFDRPDTVDGIVGEIDDAIYDMLQRKKIKPMTVVDDESFVRRIYLDTIGRIPNLKEYQSFIEDDSSDKRQALVKKLVSSPLYTSHQYNYWVSVLRARSSERYYSGQNYLNYIREAVSTNKPYNEFVYDMIASQGNPSDRGNGAVGYYFRDNNMFLDNLSNTTKLFLATDMSCAQCHDDPFKEWSQKDYYQLAAYSSGIKYRSKDYSGGDFRKTKKYEQIRKNPAMNAVFRNLSNISSYHLHGGGTGLIRLPHDYQYRDAKPLDVVMARTLFGAQPRMRILLSNVQPIKPNKRNIYPTPGKDINSREGFAKWLTDKNNPMFTKTIVNRIWHKVMGSNLIGPLTEMDTRDFGPNPLLTKKLVKTMISLNYDLRAFETLLLSTQAYQRETVNRDLNPEEDFYFEGPIMTRLSAEQLWDSLLLLRDDQYDKYYQMTLKEDQTMKLYASIKGKSMNQIANMIPSDVGSSRKFLQDLAGGASAGSGSMMMSTPPKGKGAKGKKGKGKASSSMSMNMMNMSSEASRKSNSKYRRSSEEPSPAKKGHFLLEFGQGLRETINDTSKEPSVPQVLMLMNGHIETIINDRNASLNRHVQSSSKDKQLKMTFNVILNRDPSEKEAERLKSWRLHDVSWVLLNSNDFLFRR